MKKEVKNTAAAAPEEEQPMTEEEKARQAKAKKRKWRIRAIRDTLVRAVFLVLVLYVTFFHLVGVTPMPNNDMYPRLDAGDLLLFYRLENQFRAQDIIVFEKPTSALETAYDDAADGSLDETAIQEDTDGETADQAEGETHEIRKALNFLGFKDPNAPPVTRFVCRVVAAPGDTVEIAEGDRLLVNGNAMIETNIFYPTIQYYGFVEFPLTLGPDEYFVLADYRNGGADSRFFGPVKKDEILGTVIAIMRRNNL